MRGLQVGAGSLVDCCSLLLPPMVWTRDYAEQVLIRSVGVNNGQIEDQIAGLVDAADEMTIDLGNTLTAERYELLVSEVALRLPVGPRQVMARQLRGNCRAGAGADGYRSGLYRSRQVRTPGCGGFWSHSCSRAS